MIGTRSGNDPVLWPVARRDGVVVAKFGTGSRRWHGGGLGVLRRPLRAEALLALARRRSGLDEFGDTSFVDPLRRLLAACTDEASLSLVGRMATRWDVVRFLTNLLRFQDAEHARSWHPARSRSNGRSSSPACRAAAPPSCTGCWWRIRRTARRWSGRRSIRIRPARTADARPARWRASCAPSSGWRPASARCTRSTPPRRRSAARSPRMCSTACASTRPTTYRATGDWLDQAGHGRPTGSTGCSSSISSTRRAAGAGC